MSESLLDRVAYARPYELRWGWRLLLFLLAAFAVTNVGVPLVAIVLPASLQSLLHPALQCGAILAATWYVTTAIEPVGWRGVGLGRAAWRVTPVLLALVVGAVAVAAPTVIAIAAGALGFVASPDEPLVRALATSVMVLAPAALSEELLLRGYPFIVLRARWGLPAAIALTSVVFGLLHVNNPGATPTAIANVMAAGVFLAGIRVVTGSLVAAWAAHFAWNWTLAAGFHTAVSGLPFGTPGYRLVDTGADWLSGGEWGPEGSVLVAVGMMGTFAGLSWAMGQTRGSGTMAAAAERHSLDAGDEAGRQEHSA